MSAQTNSHLYKQSLTGFMSFNAALISLTNEPHLESFTNWLPSMTHDMWVLDFHSRKIHLTLSPCILVMTQTTGIFWYCPLYLALFPEENAPHRGWPRLCAVLVHIRCEVLANRSGHGQVHQDYLWPAQDWWPCSLDASGISPLDFM